MYVFFTVSSVHAWWKPAADGAGRESDGEQNKEGRSPRNDQAEEEAQLAPRQQGTGAHTDEGEWNSRCRNLEFGFIKLLLFFNLVLEGRRPRAEDGEQSAERPDL